ncbi:cytochrome P450 [Nocardioides sp. zg-579]|uniref:Cytochrome P450 n=1 Tax=Nocardioides marmotae TaxID=2663857 RepID=A0A6I3JDL6_9ACTN|nr:cytochrome P450 [Gordonia jinghuaiqii]MTB96169.1 cytochrome P450 [Nocardioides marmotae]QKD99756.1 cytochrome P450 [Nocardioides marmotae]
MRRTIPEGIGYPPVSNPRIEPRRGGPVLLRTATRPLAPRAEALRSAARPAVRWGLGHALPRTAIGAAARRGDLHGRLIVASSTTSEVPVDLFDAIRASGPLHRSRYAYVTATLPVVREVLANPDVRAGIDLGTGTGPLGRLGRWAHRTTPMGPLTPPSLLVTEPPDHTRMRKLVTRVFSVRAVQRLRERTEEIADDLLTSLAREAGDRPVDLVEAYCALLPVTVIAEILGVPDSERKTVLDFGTAAAPSLDLGLSWRRFRSVEGALASFEAWLADHVEAKRRDPGEDLLSQMVAARDDDGVALTDRELIATAGLVLAAGFETTVNLLSNGIALLHDHPNQRALLAAEPDRWPTAVEEVLRIDPPVLLTGRTVLRDTEVAGVRMPRGAVVTTLLAGANRDPEVFTDPHRFDVTRENAADHVSFSAGRHFCLGAALARMEGQVGLQRITERFPDLRLAPGPTRRDTRILRGFETLPAYLS